MSIPKSLSKERNIAYCLLDRFDRYIESHSYEHIKKHGTKDLKSFVSDICLTCDHCDLRRISTKRFSILSILIQNAMGTMDENGNTNVVESLGSVNMEIIKFVLANLNKDD